jgi:hypothetical protein
MRSTDEHDFRSDVTTISYPNLGLLCSVKLRFKPDPAVTPYHNSPGTVKFCSAAYASSATDADSACAQQDALEDKEASRREQGKK